ncbi:hypothetical protein GGI07_001814 [Coemansia sp. Benny D115]|nr:hypothetical protein GGI07_001814 [Coemansia sp. Benny D115]
MLTLPHRAQGLAHTQDPMSGLALAHAQQRPQRSSYSADSAQGSVASRASSRNSGQSTSSSGSSSGSVEKVSRLEKLKSLPEALEEGVLTFPLELDGMNCPPAFREQLEDEAFAVLDLSRLLARSPLPLFLRIHETKAATTHVLLLTVAPGATRLDRVTRSALKLGWPRVTSIKIFSCIGSLSEELGYKIWMPRDYKRYFPNLKTVSYVAYNSEQGYFREMRHEMGVSQQQGRSVVFRASQRHADVLGLSARLMRYMAHANFLLTHLGLTISAEGGYADYVFTVIRSVLLTDLAAPTSLRLDVDSTDLLYKVTENKTLHLISSYTPGKPPADEPDELDFSKPSVRELTLRFREIGKLGIPFAARHFPSLERLVLTACTDVGHPSLENTLYGCMFLEQWPALRRLQLAHINDTLVQLLASSCPLLSELIVFNAATHEELVGKHSFDIHRTLIPLPSMPMMRFTPKSLHYLLTRFPHLRVLDLNYPLYVDPLTRAQDIDRSLAGSLLRAVEADGSMHPRYLRYLSLPFIPLTAHGIGGILAAFPKLLTLEVRLASPLSSQGTPRPVSRGRRQQLLAKMRASMGRSSTHHGHPQNTTASASGQGSVLPAFLAFNQAGSSGGVPGLGSLWVWSDWASATTTLGSVIDLFVQAGQRVPKVYIPYVAGVDAASEVDTRLILQHMGKEMPWVSVHRFEYNVGDYYAGYC